MPARKLQDFLDERHVKYITMTHSPSYTAQEVAASAHVPGREMAKTVMVKLDGKIAMAVVSANDGVDFQMLKKVTHCNKAELASEEEFRDLFPDCEVGAMPPFGNLYGVTVCADRHLSEDREIAFNAGSHRELMRLSYRDFEELVHPTVGEFAAAH